MKIRGQVFSVILAGGQSSRLFPFNKVLSDLTGQGKSLLQQAVHRLPPSIPTQNKFILTAPSMVPAMRKQLGWGKEHFFADPVRRGTWPALLWAMAQVRLKDPEALLAVVTGDHVIGDLPRFRKAVLEALEIAAAQESIVMIGVEPSPQAADWAGFGVFRRGESLSGLPGQKVSQFEEKPSLEKARRYSREGGWLWNAGMFFFQLSTAEKALAQLQPEQYQVYLKIAAALQKRKTKEAQRLFGDFPAKIPHPLDAHRTVDNTIDFAVMTPITAGQGPEELVAALADTSLRNWQDVGTWPALRKVIKKDRAGNVVLGKVEMGAGVRNCIVVAGRGARIRVKNLQNCIVSVSGSQALIIPEDEAARIKELTVHPNAATRPRITQVECDRCQFSVKKGSLVAAGLRDISVRFEKGRLIVQPVEL